MHHRTGSLRAATLINAAVVLLAACTSAVGGGATAPAESTPSPAATAPSATSTPATTPSGGTASSGPSAAPSTPAVVLDQAWATADLVDAATGETFRIADHAGKVILVETMAIWCSNCRSQQRDVQEALSRLPTDSVVFVVLDVDPNEDTASLAAYREQQGFTGRYAVAGKDVARALADEFGDQFLNPPSTPMLIIGSDGTVTRTDFGHKSPNEIVALAEAHGA
jgi:thiol-disulfide isomerase/thioredoxin